MGGCDKSNVDLGKAAHTITSFVAAKSLGREISEERKMRVREALKVVAIAIEEEIKKPDIQG